MFAEHISSLTALGLSARAGGVAGDWTPDTGRDDVKTTLRGDSSVLKVAIAVMGIGAPARSEDITEDVRLSFNVGGGDPLTSCRSSARRCSSLSASSSSSTSASAVAASFSLFDRRGLVSAGISARVGIPATDAFRSALAAANKRIYSLKITIQWSVPQENQGCVRPNKKKEDDE